MRGIPTQQVAFDLRLDLYERLRAHAASTGQTQRTILEDLIEDELPVAIPPYEDDAEEDGEDVLG